MSSTLSSPIRAIWLIDSLSLGGAESLALSLSAAPVASGDGSSGLDIQLVALKSGLRGVPRRELPNTPAWVVGSRGLRDRAALGRLTQRVQDLRPHLIHAHLTDATIWGDIVARRLKLPLAVTLHVDPDSRSSLGPVAAWMRRRLERRALRRAAGVAGVSNAVAAMWENRGGLAGRKVRVVRSGVDTGRFKPVNEAEKRSLRIALDLPADRFVITTTAVLRREKGIEVFLKAIDALADEGFPVQAMIVGSGPEAERLRASAVELGDRVRFLGARADVEAVLAASDAFVLASEREALPTVLLEAMATGLPVIATRVGGVPEAIENESSGLIVPVGSVEALVESVKRLMLNPGDARTMATAARQRAEERFSLEAWGRRLADWYVDLLDLPGAADFSAVAAVAETSASKRLRAENP